MKQKSIIGHVTPVGGNVFADLGFPPEEAKKLLEESHKEIKAKIALKKAMMSEVTKWIAENNMRQEEAAVVLGISRPRISDVVTQKTSKFTLDALVGMLSRAGKKVSMSVA